MVNKCSLKFFFVKKLYLYLIFLTVLNIFILNYFIYKPFEYDKSIKSELLNDHKKFFLNETKHQNLFKKINHRRFEEKCDPFYKYDKQYSVQINGQNYPKAVTLYRNKSINFECLNKNEKIKTILFWNSFFGDETVEYGIGEKDLFIQNKCPVYNCKITTNKQEINESDLVITHMRDPIEQVPIYRPLNQKWVFMLYESPAHSEDYSNYSDIYNLTSTYRLDSDFPDYYFNFLNMKWERNELFDKNFDYFETKTNFSAAIISNCNDQSGRLEYLEKLKNYISLDIFGRCGQECPYTWKDNNNITDNCKQIIGEKYKFYFSFENSICKDYITEKFFDILRYNIIPVVHGGGDYEHFVIYFYFILIIFIFCFILIIFLNIFIFVNYFFLF
jgi:hypothetical protein